MKIIGALFLLSTFEIAFSQHTNFNGQHAKTLQGGVYLEWTVENMKITLKLSAPTTGWIGFGISPSGVMYAADILITGTWTSPFGYALDSIGFGHAPPYVDPVQDWIGLEYYEVNGLTTVVVSRKLKTGDLYDRDITAGKMKIIWAMGERDITKGKPSPNDAHNPTSRGTEEIEFIQVPQPVMQLVSLSEDVTLQWSYDATTITFEMTAPTKGWVGLGFSPGTTMANADLIICGQSDTDGKGYIYDGFSSWNGNFRLDGSTDATLIRSMQDSSETKVVFTRKRITGDNMDRAIMVGTTNVLWAYASTDASFSPYKFDYHIARGYMSLKLISE